MAEGWQGHGREVSLGGGFNKRMSYIPQRLSLRSCRTKTKQRLLKRRSPLQPSCPPCTNPHSARGVVCGKVARSLWVCRIVILSLFLREGRRTESK